MTPKRPRDPNQLAKSIIDIATGQKPDRDPTPEEQGKDPAAVALGRKGGKARAANMTAKDRSEVAKRAALKRWGKKQYSGTCSLSENYGAMQFVPACSGAEN
jgi:hypothetical protein